MNIITEGRINKYFSRTSDCHGVLVTDETTLVVIQPDSSSQDHRIGVAHGVLEVTRPMYSNSASLRPKSLMITVAVGEGSRFLLCRRFGGGPATLLAEALNLQ
jgi:hypothetical protein